MPLLVVSVLALFTVAWFYCFSCFSLVAFDFAVHPFSRLYFGVLNGNRRVTVLLSSLAGYLSFSRLYCWTVYNVADLKVRARHLVLLPGGLFGHNGFFDFFVTVLVVSHLLFFFSVVLCRTSVGAFRGRQKVLLISYQFPSDRFFSYVDSRCDRSAGWYVRRPAAGKLVHEVGEHCTAISICWSRLETVPVLRLEQVL